jgi:hypothetical protein
MDTKSCAQCGTDTTCSHPSPVIEDASTESAVAAPVGESPPVEVAPGSRRARLEAKLERRTVWAGKAAARSESRFARARSIGDGIPFGQPILVGHHSERRSRADAQRIHSNLTKAVEESHLAEHHEQRAAGLAAQLKRSVFSDDTNAIDALEARIAQREAQVERRKAINAAFKKATGEAPTRFAALVAAGLLTQEESLSVAGTMASMRYDRPFPSYSLTNLTANIRRDRERIAELKLRQERTETARAQGGVKLEGVGEYVRVTFAEKPTREVLEALREAGFRWGGGSWVGERAKLPADVVELAAAD